MVEGYGSSKNSMAIKKDHDASERTHSVDHLDVGRRVDHITGLDGRMWINEL